MRRLRAFPLDEVLFTQAMPGFLLCVGWAVMYEIYHEDGSYYTTLMQEILGGEGLFPYFLASALLMAFPVGLVIDTVREVVGERWLGVPRGRTGPRSAPSSLQLTLLPLVPLESAEDRYALYRRARAGLLSPAKASGNIALVLLTLLIWFVVKIVLMQGWHVFSPAFLIGTPVFGMGIVGILFVRYAVGMAEYRRLVHDAMSAPSDGPPVPPSDSTGTPRV